jgi:hypothetical protein
MSFTIRSVTTESDGTGKKKKVTITGTKNPGKITMKVNGAPVTVTQTEDSFKGTKVFDPPVSGPCTFEVEHSAGRVQTGTATATSFIVNPTSTPKSGTVRRAPSRRAGPAKR